ncbi:MAG: SRPBCC family protein [Acidimicrobiales bacterium]
MTDAPTDDELGTLDQRDGRWELTFVRRSSHPVEEVWRAVTDPEHLAVWFPTTVDGDRSAGSPLTFSFPFPDAPPMRGEVLVFDPFERFEFRWGDEVISIELTALDDGGCELRFVDRFDELGKAARDAAGWHACLDRLGFELDGAQWPWGPDGRWAVVHPLYVERLGPEASVIGPPDRHSEPT